MGVLEIEVDDDVAAELEALFAAHPEWSEAERWRAVLWDGIDRLTREPPELDDDDRMPTEAEVRAAEAERRAAREQKLGADLAWAVDVFLGRRPGERRKREPRFVDMRLDVSVAADLAVVAVWLEKARRLRYGADPEAVDVSIDMSERDDLRLARQHVRDIVRRSLTDRLAWLHWGWHPGSGRESDDARV
ncbi:hypothetical protein [Arvimicrobium flavum]|uniref:hypothetical protein n=1 Tax=Arvimicrobium flavum TaxID=3393320 RepID=UPI00237AEEDC|nr:hypothetical protein [Mesorhizobium shangrilense]